MINYSQQALYDKLLCLIEANELSIFTELISENVDISFSDNELLKTACALNKIDFVKLLIEKNSDINADDGFPLRISCERGYLNIVQLLVDKGADINIQKGDALSSASSEGHLNVVQFLIEKGANPLLSNDYSLIWSFRNKHYSTFSYLLDNGCDFFILKQSLKDDLLSWAAFYNQIDFVDLFLNLNADPEILIRYKNIEIQTALKNFFIKKNVSYLENQLTNKDTIFQIKKTKI